MCSSGNVPLLSCSVIQRPRNVQVRPWTLAFVHIDPDTVLCFCALPLHRVSSVCPVERLFDLFKIGDVFRGTAIQLKNTVERSRTTMADFHNEIPIDRKSTRL